MLSLISQNIEARLILGAILPIWENSGVGISQQKQFQQAAVVF